MSLFKQPDEDNDLTNLSWLHNVSSILPGSTRHEENASKTVKTKKVVTPTQKASKNVSVTTNELEDQHVKMIKSGSYKKNAKVKPPFSYAALICLAMKSCPKEQNKLSLSQIYSWIKENFAYYRQSDQSWQVRFSVKF